MQNKQTFRKSSFGEMILKVIVLRSGRDLLGLDKRVSRRTVNTDSCGYKLGTILRPTSLATHFSIYHAHTAYMPHAVIESDPLGLC